MNKKRVWTIVLVAAILLLVIASVIAVSQWIKARNNGQHDVVFYANDGTILKIDPVSHGKTATPPVQPQMIYGTVFQSWNTDITSVKKELEVHPVVKDVNGIPNVFAIEGAYGKSGGTTIVPVRLCGDVCLAAFDMTISYDPELLELVSVSEDGAVLYNDETPGQIRLNYVSVGNTLADVDICLLEFSVKAQPSQTPVSLEVHSVYASEDSLESNNDDLYVPEYSVVDGTVFVLPGEE